MSFFQGLFEITDGMAITITTMRKNDKMTISVLPQTVHKVQPIVITGTPQELEEGFFNAIAAPIKESKGLKVETTAYSDSIKKAAEKGLDKSVEKNQPKAIEGTKKSSEQPKKESVVKPTEKPKAITDTMFD